jgi:DNA-binding NarL/FixJ family response regulator
MRSQRIFILSPHTLLARGVELLLTGRPVLRIVGTETDMGEGIRRICRLHPDVVILGNGGQPSMSLEEVSSVFEASPGTAVVVLRPADNLLHVYQDDEVTVANVEDLVQAIRRIGQARPRPSRRWSA